MLSDRPRTCCRQDAQLQVMPSAWPSDHLGKQHAVATGSRLTQEAVVTACCSRGRPLAAIAEKVQKDCAAACCYSAAQAVDWSATHKTGTDSAPTK